MADSKQSEKQAGSRDRSERGPMEGRDRSADVSQNQVDKGGNLTSRRRKPLCCCARRFWRWLLRPGAPTESQKFRANVVATFLGSFVLAIAVVLIGLFFERRERAWQADKEEVREERRIARERVLRRADAVKEFTKRFPNGLRLVNAMMIAYGKFAERGNAEMNEWSAKHACTWEDLRKEYYEARDQYSFWGDPTGDCLLLIAHLQKKETIEAVRALRTKVNKLPAIPQDGTFSIEIFTRNYQETAGMYDKVLEAIDEELRYDGESPPSGSQGE